MRREAGCGVSQKVKHLSITPAAICFAGRFEFIRKECDVVVFLFDELIGKKANFRSATSIVKVLNHMRPALPQAVKDESFIGSAAAFHTNDWVGTRRDGAGGGHWKGDLPAEIGRAHV